MFDTFFGLPLHALVIHAVVVGLPVAAVASLAVAARPAWRARYLGWVVLLDGLNLIGVLVARQSGLAFYDRLNQPAVARSHREWGLRLVWLFLALMVVVVALWALQRAGSRAGLLGGVGALVAILSVATLVLVTVVGHMGSTAVWKATVDSTSNP